MAKTKKLPPSKGKSTRSSTKDKYPVVAHIDINTDTHSHDIQDDPLEPLNSSSHLNIPVTHLQSLRGHGSQMSNLKGPMYTGNFDKFTSFRHKLDNFLLINGVFHVIDDVNCESSLNTALYLYISSCLDGEPFNHICANAKNDGRLAYQILVEKYTGNIHARKQKAYSELANLKQKEGETISAYISRIDMIIERISHFKLFNDTSYYVTCAMKGLLPKYDIFRAVINSHEDYPTWEQFKIRIQNHAQLHCQSENSQIMAVTATNPSVQILKRKQNNNYKKFMNKNNQPDPDRYCTYCDTKTHWSHECNHKSWILASGGLRGHGGGRGRGTSQRGRGRGNHIAAHTYRGSYLGRGRGANRGNARGAGATGTYTGRGNGANRGRANAINNGANSFYNYNPNFNTQANNANATGANRYSANFVNYDFPDYQNQFA